MREIEFTKDDLRRAHAFPRQITREGISSLAAFAIRLLAERDAIMDKWAIESDESLTECVERNLTGAMKRFKTAEAERDALRERWGALWSALYREGRFECGEAYISLKVVGSCPTVEEFEAALDAARSQVKP